MKNMYSFHLQCTRIGFCFLLFQSLLLVSLLRVVNCLDRLRFDLEYVPRGYLDTAPWQWRFEIELPISMPECFNIITDFPAKEYWYPEVTVLEAVGTLGQEGAGWTLEFDDFLLNLVSFGKPIFQVVVDVLEPFGDNQRSLGFFMTKSSRENAVTFNSFREEYTCEAIDGEPRKSMLIRRSAAEPGSVGHRVDFLIYRRLSRIFEYLCPTRLESAVLSGLLPRNISIAP